MPELPRVSQGLRQRLFDLGYEIAATVLEYHSEDIIVMENQGWSIRDIAQKLSIEIEKGLRQGLREQ